MSFKSRDLMTNVLLAGKPFAHPGLNLCNDNTRNQEEAPCADASDSPKKRTPAAQREMDLAMLRRELRQTLTGQAAGF